VVDQDVDVIAILIDRGNKRTVKRYVVSGVRRRHLERGHRPGVLVQHIVIHFRGDAAAGQVAMADRVEVGQLDAQRVAHAHDPGAGEWQ
jgi:ribosomal protein L3